MKNTYKNDFYEADFSCGNTAKGICKDSEKVVFIKRWHSENMRAKNEIDITGRIESGSVCPFSDVFTEDGMTYAAAMRATLPKRSSRRCSVLAPTPLMLFRTDSI